jgi:hypothetical protein
VLLGGQADWFKWLKAVELLVSPGTRELSRKPRMRWLANRDNRIAGLKDHMREEYRIRKTEYSFDLPLAKA